MTPRRASSTSLSALGAASTAVPATTSPTGKVDGGPGLEAFGQLGRGFIGGGVAGGADQYDDGERVGQRADEPALVDPQRGGQVHDDVAEAGPRRLRVAPDDVGGRRDGVVVEVPRGQPAPDLGDQAGDLGRARTQPAQAVEGVGVGGGQVVDEGDDGALGGRVVAYGPEGAGGDVVERGPHRRGHHGTRGGLSTGGGQDRPGQVVGQPGEGGEPHVDHARAEPGQVPAQRQADGTALHHHRDRLERIVVLGHRDLVDERADRVRTDAHHPHRQGHLGIVCTDV